MTEPPTSKGLIVLKVSLKNRSQGVSKGAMSSVKSVNIVKTKILLIAPILCVTFSLL